MNSDEKNFLKVLSSKNFIVAFVVIFGFVVVFLLGALYYQLSWKKQGAGVTSPGSSGQSMEVTKVGGRAKNNEVSNRFLSLIGKVRKVEGNKIYVETFGPFPSVVTGQGLEQRKSFSLIVTASKNTLIVKSSEESTSGSPASLNDIHTDSLLLIEFPEAVEINEEGKEIEAKKIEVYSTYKEPLPSNNSIKN